MEGQRRSTFAAAALALVMVSVGAAGLTANARAAEIPQGNVASTLALGTNLGALSPQFWGLDMSCSSCSNQTQAQGQYSSQSSALLNATPFVHNGNVWVRVMGNTECTNVTTGQCYSSSGVPGSSNFGGSVLTSLKTFCTWYSCHVVMPIAIEQNRSGYVSLATNYILNTIGFPASEIYDWSFGNEPSNYKHWGIQWTSWNPADNAKPGIPGYTAAVRSFASIVTGLSPGAKVDIGELASSPNNWYQALGTAYPTGIAAAAHLYPNGNGGAGESEQQFVTNVSKSNGIQTQIPGARAALAAGCSCSTIAYDVHEFNLGLSTTYIGAWLANPPGVALLAQAYLEAMDYNLTQINQFDWMDTSQGIIGDGPTYTPGWEYPLFSQIFDKMWTNDIHNTTVTGLPDLYASEGGNPANNSQSLLLVNLNLTQSTTVTIPATVIPSNEQWTVYTLSAPNQTTAAVSQYIAPPGATVTLAPFQVTLINAVSQPINQTGRTPSGFPPGQQPPVQTPGCPSLLCNLPPLPLPNVPFPAILGVVFIASAALIAFAGRRVGRWPSALLLVGGIALVILGG